MASPITSSINPAPTTPSFSPSALSRIAICDLGIRVCLICLVIIVLATFVLAVLSIPNFIPVMSPVYCLPGWIVPFIIIAILNIHKHKTAKAHGFSLKDFEKLAAPQPESLPPVEPTKKSTHVSKRIRRKKRHTVHQKSLLALPLQDSDNDNICENNRSLNLSSSLENLHFIPQEISITHSPILQKSSKNIMISLSNSSNEDAIQPLNKSSSSSLQPLPDLP